MTMTTAGRSPYPGSSRMVATTRVVLVLLVLYHLALLAVTTAKGVEDHASTSNTAATGTTDTSASTSSGLLRKRRRRNTSSRSVQEQHQQQHRPNVLMIVADQMRYDMIRYVQDTLPQYNDRLKISTPNLDKLLQSGAYFETSYTQCAVCAPARATLRTGTTIERHGVQHNDLTRDENLYYYETTTTDEDIDGNVDIDDQEEQIFDDVEVGGAGSDENQTQPPPSSTSPQQQEPFSSSSKLAFQFSDRVNSVKTIDHLLVQSEGYVSEYYGKLHLPRAMSFEKLPEHLFLDPINNNDGNNMNAETQGTTTLSRRSYNLDRPIFQHNDYDYANEKFTFQFDR